MAQFIRHNHNTSYIAYEQTPSRHPLTLVYQGTQIQVHIHPDIFINEFVSVKVKNIIVGRETANIQFDASSVITADNRGMKYDFGANTSADSPIVDLARHAMEQNRAVYVGIETRRRFKNRQGRIISYTTPIHILRGCKNGSQSAAHPTEVRNNCSKIVAVMGFVDDPRTTLISPEARLNPLLWPKFRGNYDGTVPPSGFITPQSPDGTPVGGIVINPQHQGKSTSEIHAVAQVRQTRAFAAKIIANAITENTDAQHIREWESSLTRVLLWLADKVQYAITGDVDRMNNTHTEASAWIAHVITLEDPYTANMLTDIDAAKAWAKRVGSAAIERYTEALELTAEAYSIADIFSREA